MTIFWFYAVVGTVGLVLAVLLYARALASRRRVVCASCGETVRMEHDRVRHCPSCGAQLT